MNDLIIIGSFVVVIGFCWFITYGLAYLNNWVSKKLDDFLTIEIIRLQRAEAEKEEIDEEKEKAIEEYHKNNNYDNKE